MNTVDQDLIAGCCRVRVSRGSSDRMLASQKFPETRPFSTAVSIQISLFCLLDCLCAVQRFFFVDIDVDELAMAIVASDPA